MDAEGDLGYLTNIAVKFGADENRAIKEMKDVMDFMGNLSSVRTKLSCTRTKIYILYFLTLQITKKGRKANNRFRNMVDLNKLYTIKELQKQFSFVSWVRS